VTQSNSVFLHGGLPVSQIKSEIDTVGFFSNMLAVILGIVITFSIQGIINRHSQRENIRSALRLVEEEL